jgi:hypothetical protein
MAKRPPPGKCVYCVRFFDELTWDHVLPSAWYPTNTPDNMEKWKVPCCLECNSLNGKSEGELLVRLGLCINPDDPRNAGIVEKTLRALSPDSRRDDKDAGARAAQKQKILRQSFTGSDIPYQSVYPGFGPQEDVPPSERISLTVANEDRERLAQKIVRGITYLEDKTFLDESQQIKVPVLTDAEARPIEELLREGGQTYERRPAITVRRAVAHQDRRMSAVYSITIWGHFKIYAFVSPETDSPGKHPC